MNYFDVNIGYIGDSPSCGYSETNFNAASIKAFNFKLKALDLFRLFQ